MENQTHRIIINPEYMKKTYITAHTETSSIQIYEWFFNNLGKGKLPDDIQEPLMRAVIDLELEDLLTLGKDFYSLSSHTLHVFFMEIFDEAGLFSHPLYEMIDDLIKRVSNINLAKENYEKNIEFYRELKEETRHYNLQKLKGGGTCI